MSGARAASLAIRESVFTRWCNEHMRRCGHSEIDNLAIELADGLTLIHLSESVSGKPLPAYNKKITSIAKQAENLELALGFLRSSELIQLAGIAAQDIMSGQQELALNIVWELIVRYRFVGKWEGDTPREAVSLWLRERMPLSCSHVNLTTDWNDGTRLYALVGLLAPGSLPDTGNTDNSNPTGVIEIAMQAAKEKLNTPMILLPKEMADPNLDEAAMACYLSYFMEADSLAKDNLPDMSTATSPLAISMSCSHESFRRNTTPMDMSEEMVILRAGAAEAEGLREELEVALAQADSASTRAAQLEAELDKLRTELAEERAKATYKLEEAAALARTEEVLRAREALTEVDCGLREELECERSSKGQLEDRLVKATARLRAENEAILKRVAQEASSGPKYIPDGTPYIAFYIIERLTEFGGLEPEHGDEELLVGLAKELRTAASRTDDLSSSSYWLATLGALLKAFPSESSKPLSVAPVVLPGKTPPSSDERDIVQWFSLQIRGLLFGVFCASLTMVQRDLDRVIYQTMFEARQALFGNPPEPRHLRHKSCESSTTAKPTVTATLSNVLQVFQLFKVQSDIQTQFFDHLIYYINATAFNTLISNGEHCTCSNGFQIKMALSVVDDWLMRNPLLASTRCKLDHIREAANLLIMDKSILRDEEATLKTFPSLSFGHVVALVAAFHPDQLAPTPVDAETIWIVHQRARSKGYPGSSSNLLNTSAFALSKAPHDTSSIESS
eukprot:m51a1_g3746 putative b chain structure of the actin-binding domain of human filamin a (735) ;mRNA; r:66516-69499